MTPLCLLPLVAWLAFGLALWAVCAYTAPIVDDKEI